ncbi:aromatic amino acid transport family protein, partial [Chloroflexota bacterium]
LFMSDESSFFGGLDILDGMPSRQAGTILFAIEGRTGQLVTQSRQALASYLTEKTVAEKEQAFLSAIAQGRDLPLQPTIQDIERFAPEWASLVPTDQNQRAALVKKIAEKFRFRRQDVTAVRKALALDTDGVKQAYERLFQKPIDSIYTKSIPVSEQISWLKSQWANSLERMPPFWTAYSLTLTETIGGSILALPIALAGVGPLPGVILLFILGLVNILTIMGIVEAITRNGNMRYGTAYFGRLVGDYLGNPGSIILVPALLILNVLVLVVFYIGISISLADITGISPMLWPILVFLIAVYFLRRETLNATVASALVIGIIDILIIIILSVLTFPYIQAENLRYTSLPFGNGQIFNPQTLYLVFGVILAAYFGHTSAGNAAKVVLRRDPGGKSLIWGNVAALATAIALYSLWVISVNGAISPDDLINETGTALSPLALKIGGSVSILGIIYVILAMGIGSVHVSYGLYYQVREVLPPNVKRTIQFLISVAPIFLLFILVEWMLFTNRESFSWLLGIIGVLLVPILGGIFPMLMLAASRRKGDYAPKLSFGFLGNPLVLTIVYFIYLGSVFIYGFFIWEDPIQRVIAIGVGIVVLIVTYLVIRQGAFASRVVIELKVEISDTDERATMTIIDKGKPLTSTFRFVYVNGEQSISGTDVEIPSYKQLKNIFIEFSSVSSKEMKVWLHRVTPEGNSEPIFAALRIKDGGTDAAVQLDPKTSQVIIPLTSRVSGLEITLK